MTLRFCVAIAAAVLAGGVQAADLRMDGEVYARSRSALMPPAVDGLWQYNISQFAPDGSPVKQGQPVLAFDSSELMKRLTAKQSELNEKQTQLDTLRLDHAERERNERVSTAEALANREKAQRKAEQPEELIAGVQYRKLVIEREAAARREALAGERERLASEQRRQEMRVLASEVERLEAEIGQLQHDMVAMQVAAPRDGLMIHRSSWNGEKFDVGSQVWRGQTVAEIPDATTLAVTATLPERDLLRVSVGAPVRVVIEGGAGSAMRGRITGIGQAVRSKSRLQPVPVVDLDITLDAVASGLKPGQAVRVELAMPGAANGREARP
ncbi:HlyD family secretion protein [Marilutibacter alkalisoli]|uniref:HlyD family efflux transporter periplasmic adaptor subunit n=1 Tax=Marilutibacter alkalisoli TaxID=2591633 RepID=A0A514BP74_9GAMM|nr:HlyD family efflux transporter periplasmic adaptor subunit [Lysobacter alkalisoli]QDH69183.1 HlyD family efflux transporter periplasmic adaptor subunit [Lysobacter alkalisoli]